MRYSHQPRDRIFVKGYGHLSFAKNMAKNTVENISKNLSSKYSQKLLHHAKKSTTDALKTSSKRVIQKIAEATRDLVATKIADKIAKASKNLQHNNLETVTNDQDKEIPKERYRYIQKKDKKLLRN